MGCLGWQTVDIVALLRSRGEDLVVAGLAERVGEPLETLVQTKPILFPTIVSQIPPLDITPSLCRL